MGQLYGAIFFLGALVALSLSITPVYGQTNYDFTTINQDQIKTSSVAKDMLAKIEESKRILKEEHRIYPEAVNLIAKGKVKVSGRKTVIS